ncbi:MAG: hypothetical protein NFW17_16270 [Candidatus Accumulibacter sp.]|uniref:hypothetical protein n=1 Tax=Accumulibacter sp. TaxID=2053492 RepID=UPI0025CB7AAB|nr:hypothetical protein [Accumulibacter sp.]MCM8613603.1 hypothetical protein [Accumulibacter sp.]MCM8641482.1 hypothetical protein [Accumulibacter sp.]
MSVAPQQGPLVKKLLRLLAQYRSRKIIDLQAFAAGRQHAIDQQGSVVSPQRLADLHPAHAIYVYAQNQASVLMETITELPALDKLTNLIVDASEEYMPSGPPMSPLTSSYFFYWSCFDAAIGTARETIGDCIAALARCADAHPDFLTIIDIMRQSRMGLYVCEGRDQGSVRLREFVTGEIASCIVPAGHGGQRGEIWLARVLPPPGPEFAESVVITTPYVIIDPGERDWQRFLERTLPKTGIDDPRRAYCHLMKYGLDLRYWSEYILEAYVNYETSLVYLRGLPDVAGSRPHGA